MAKKRLNEVPPKWNALKTVVEELSMNRDDVSKSKLNLLIVASDETVCKRLKELMWNENQDNKRG